MNISDKYININSALQNIMTITTKFKENMRTTQ